MAQALSCGNYKHNNYMPGSHVMTLPSCLHFRMSMKGGTMKMRVRLRDPYVGFHLYSWKGRRAGGTFGEQFFARLA